MIPLFKGSRRDLERAIQVQREIRLSLTQDHKELGATLRARTTAAGLRFERAVALARQEYDAAVAKAREAHLEGVAHVNETSDNLQALVNILTTGGDNLAQASRHAKARAVRDARRDLDTILARLEQQRSENREERQMSDREMQDLLHSVPAPVVPDPEAAAPPPVEAGKAVEAQVVPGALRQPGTDAEKEALP